MSAKMASSNGGSVDPEIIELLRSNTKPFMTATEVAEALSVTRQYAHSRLSELEEAGEIQKDRVGAKAVVWWIPS